MFVNGPPATATYTLSLHDALPISFGTWTVDEASKTITVRYVGGMFPNQAGTEAKRIVVSVTADELRSEERRVGKESRSGRLQERDKKRAKDTIRVEKNTVSQTERK